MKFSKKVNDLEGRMLGFKHRMTERIRRMCAVALSASLVVSGFPSIPMVTLAADDTAEYTFDLTTDDLSSAIATALSEGTTVDKELDFRGEYADEYDELFDPDGTLYELKSLEYEKDVERDKDLQLRVFVRITGDIPLDMDIDDLEDSEEDDEDSIDEAETVTEYVPDGTEPLIFLIVDRSKDEVNAVVRVDDAETEVITVYPASEIPDEGSTASLKSAAADVDEAEAEIEISISDTDDEETGEEITEDSDVSVEDREIRGGKKNAAGGGGGESSGRGGNSRKDSSSEDDNNSDEKDASADENDNNSGEDSASGNDGNDEGNDSSSEKSDSSSEKSDSSSEKADSSESTTGSDNTSSGSSDSGSNDSDSSTGNSSSSGSSDNSSSSTGSSNSSDSSDSSSSGNDSSSSGSTGRSGRSGRSSGGSSGSGSSEESGEKTASISIHETNLLAAEIASSSNIIKASASDASPSDASPSDAMRSINGTVYEPVLLGRRGAVAFETNLQEVGLGYGIQLLSENPKFTVQFYANMDTIFRDHQGDDVDLMVIETHIEEDGNTHAELPRNAPSDSTEYYNTSVIELTSVDSSKNEYKIDSRLVLTQMYKDETYNYQDEPTIHYMNKLELNSDYKLAQIWKLNEGGDSTSTDNNNNDWTVYTVERIGDTEEYTMKFTNNKETADESPDEYILVDDNDVFRFVYDTTENEANLPVYFYDYDIANGNVYSEADTTSPSWTEGTKYLYTYQQGINNPENYDGYDGSQAKYAFGNSNGGTSLGNEVWKDEDDYENIINAMNSHGLNSCVFGLVEGLDANGNIQFADGIVAPNLFEGGDAVGKTKFDGRLYFNRKGDTYTLSSAGLSDGTTLAEDLDTFIGRSGYKGGSSFSRTIYSNDFWPMDKVSYDGKDPLFGNYDDYADGLVQHFGYGSPGNLPPSDDSTDHDSYCGMYFQIEFSYTEDYIGPLEYFFFGDDDMWIFLDGTLILDIGGVHSSVGEHVDLWDYLQDDTFNDDGIAEHTLRLFWTERGASGSTCYMQYTLPQVTSVMTYDNANDLIIEKQVEGVTTDQEFEFEITLTQDGSPLTDEYGYIVRNQAGNFQYSDVIKNGDTIKLKDGWTAQLRNLPIGSTVEVTEINGSGFSTTYEVGVDGGSMTESGTGSTATGTVLEQEGGYTYIRFINSANASEKGVDADNDGVYDDSGIQRKLGDTLSYEITYENYFDTAVTVTVTDVLDDGLTYVSSNPTATVSKDDDGHTVLTWTIENVTSGLSGSVTFTATINENAFETNEIENTASVKIGDDPAVDTNPVYTPVPEKGVDTNNDDKFDDDDNLVQVGQELTYKIDYMNSYDDPANITISDTLDKGLTYVSSTPGATVSTNSDGQTVLTWEINNVPAHEGGSVTFTATVNDNAQVAKEVDNTAYVKINNDDEVATNPVENPVPHKDVDADGDDEYGDSGMQVNVGDTLTYIIEYQNTYDETVTVTITDVLDKGLDFVSADNDGTYDEDTRTITWEVEAEPKESGSVTFKATVNEDALEKNEVDNTAKVKIKNEVDTNTVYNPVPGKDVDVPEDGEGEDDKFGDSGVGVQVGDILTYEIDYFNGYDVSSTVTITDELDEGLDFIEASGGGIYDESTRTITWTISGVEAHTGGSVTFTAKVNEKAHVVGVVNNEAKVEVGDNSTYTNEVENPLTHKDVDIDATDGLEYGDSGLQVNIGDTLTYKIEYQNMHDEPATVTITDVLDKGLDFESADNGGTYDSDTRTITWVIKNVAAGTEGSVTFTATVNEDALEKNEVDNTAKVQVGDDPAVDTNTVYNPVPGKDVDVPEEGESEEDKFGDNGDSVKVGDTLTYQVTFRNDYGPEYDEEGNMTSDGSATVTITDVLDNGLDYVTDSAKCVVTLEDGTVADLVVTYSYEEKTRTVKCIVEDMPSHSQGVLTFEAIVNEDALIVNVVENTAKVTIEFGDNPGVSVDTNTVYNPLPDKNVEVDGDGNFDDSGIQVVVGETLTYKIDFENPDETPAIVTITDVLDPGLDLNGESGSYEVDAYIIDPEDAETLIPIDVDVYYNPITRTLKGTIGDGETTVPAGFSGYMTFKATVNETALVKNEVDNTATVQVGDHPSQDTKTVYNPVPGKDVDVPEEDEEEPFGDNGDSVQVGDTLTYEVTFRNDYDPEYDEETGELISVTFTITDEIDPGLDYVEGSATCIVTPDDDGDPIIINDITYDEDTRTLICVIDSMPAHSKGVLTFQATVNENALEKEAVDNDAIVHVKVGNESEVETKTNPVHNPIPDKNVDANDDGEYDDSGMQVHVGDTLVYKIDYENPDDDPAKVIITDVLDVGLDYVSSNPKAVLSEEDGHTVLTWTIEEVKAHTTGSVYFTATVNGDALIKNEVDNTATVQVGDHPATDTKTVYNPVPGKDVDAPETPDRQFGDSGEDVRVGETLTYKIGFFNGYASPSDATATVTITDTLDDGLDYVKDSPKVYLIDENGDPVELTEGSDYTVDYDEDSRKLVVVIESVPKLTGGYLTFEAVVNSTALKEDEVKNTAWVQVGDDPDVAIETNEVDNPVPDKDVDVDGPDENGNYSYGDSGIGVHVGDTLYYRIHYWNGHATPSDAYAEASTTVIITDTLDEGLDYVEGSASDNGVYDEETRTITWTIENVPSDYGGYVTFQAVVNEKALVRDEVENTAKVKVNGDDFVKTDTVYNPVNHKDVDIHGDDTYGDDGLQVQVGDTLTYKIDYQNPYDEPAKITITDELDPGLDFVWASDGGEYDEGTRTITWVIEDVASHSASGYYVTFTATVNDDAYVKYEVDNIAYVQVNDDPLVYTEWIYNPVPHKGVDTDGDGEYDDDGEDVYVGDTLTYKVDFYAYASSSDAVKITITDELDEGLDYVDDSSEVYLYTDGADKDPVKIISGVTVDYSDRTLTVTIEDVPSNTQGYMTFQATVNSDALIKKIVNNKASVQVGDDPAVETNEVENHAREYYPIDERIVVDDSDESIRFNLDNWVEKESVNEYNGIEIEMTTKLPIIEIDDFVDGEFTLNFHEVLDSEHLVIDENNSDFVLYLRGDTDEPTEIPEYDPETGIRLYRITIEPDETCYIPDNDGGEPTETHCTFHVWVDLNALYDTGYIDETDLQGNTWITIFFYVDLDDDENEGLNGSYGSTVWYDVKEGEDVVYTSNSAYVYVYTYDIVISKVSSTNNRALSGAQFEIYYDPAASEDPVYRYVGGRFADSEKQIYTVTSGSDGKATFYGLAEGTYYIKEVKAPSGYVATDTVTEVTVGGTEGTNISVTISNRPRGGGGSSGGGGGSGSGGGSGTGGPGSGGSEGEGDSVWDLLPLPSTGQGWAMLIGTCALVVSALVLAVLFFFKRREHSR